MKATFSRFEVRYDNAEDFERDYNSNLKKGRLFLPRASGAEVQEKCLIVVQSPSTHAEFEIHAHAVWVDERSKNAGIGFELDRSELPRLEQFLRETLEGQAEYVRRASSTSGVSTAQDPEDAPPDDVTDTSTEEEPAEETTETGLPNKSGTRNLTTLSDVPNEGTDERSRNLYDRIRKMNPGDQQRLARSGTLAERVAVERCYSGAVWESLLANPRLTPMEVAYLARQPSLPQPLFNHILQSTAWLAAPDVQRALLSNTRLGGAQLDRVLRALPTGERTRIAQGAPGYRQAVRTAARRLLESVA